MGFCWGRLEPASQQHRVTEGDREETVWTKPSSLLSGLVACLPSGVVSSVSNPLSLQPVVFFWSSEVPRFDWKQTAPEANRLKGRGCC